ncbi:response regulator [Roseomonas marmotae]|uniref:Response regulator n=1 Tax=Roseomonas marmotae TaxID=2768161 RepID=A0ABS3KBG2_9PROT|nr:response regulator [Roseomonas marmotae]MBO1073686.1 response regulator [Roseomonas marmotae]QTI78672.1 response regulator [Roseomonas marmotae]
MIPAHILVVDDDASMRQMIRDYLTGHAFTVTAVANGAEMVRIIRAHPVDLIILDLQLAEEDGLELLRRIGPLTGAPVIIITGHRTDEIDKVVGLELGADDYLPKPFGLRELLARVRVILRRGEAADRRIATRQANLRYRFQGWELDLKRRHLIAPDGETMRLTRGEFNLLHVFLRTPQQILSRDQLLAGSRGNDQDIYDRSIDVVILRLRRKLEKDPSQPSLIRTERGLGYVFTATVDVLREGYPREPAASGRKALL